MDDVRNIARPPHRILIVSDAWMPQVNGVVRTLSTIAGELRAMGHVVEVIGPDRFRTIPCPTYPDIRLSIFPGRRLARLIEDFAPDRLHIATEGPLGIAARRWAIRHGHRFTTSFHTRFPEYLQARTNLPLGPSYAFLRRFHNASSGTMVATASLADELRGRGFRHIVSWSRGVDLSRFSPEPRRDWAAEYGIPRPIFLYVGRIAVEKNIPAFLALDLPGSKVVVGGGPLLGELKQRFPDVVFTGPFSEAELAAAYAGGDVFVFPSRTDTFGLVLLEALASGVPVAAFDVTGPRDVLAGTGGAVGSVGDDLRAAALAALGADRAACRAHAERFGWPACAQTFLRALVPLTGERPSVPA
ncbi:glycosyltransferase family 1 protein [Acetobacteraceae bacterium KSS8]|uniref:Glycosyltransferase family 1 protein n=1 Tax=Endosaccharibacter trunci TaxID=2812733 RepID=A0ABT1W7L2_9PROT|nr:glycosyltransferase family 1 protein [Acetobacteraceae bacterium KSS8]